MTYQQWSEANDRAQLITQVSTVEDLIEITVQILNKVIPHHYTANKKAQYFKESKENPDDSSAVVLLDFRENYTFVTQNVIQSHYWARNSCTLYPVVIYVKNGEQVIPESICFITEDLK